MGIPRKGGQCLWVIYSNIVPLSIKISPSILKHTLVIRLTPKNNLKSFLDAPESHKTSANLSDRDYFR